MNKIINSLLAVLILALGLIHTSQAVETITYFHEDAGGSPIAATDEAGNLLWRESYQPYGDRLKKQDGNTNKIWFHGKQQDPDTGLSYFGARYYDPVVGRFMGIDPQSYEESNPHSFNRYAYGNNNPYKFVDPDGQIAILFNLVRGAILWIAERQAATVAVTETVAAVSSGAVVPGVAVEAAAAKITSKELREAGRATFEASKAEKLIENGGKCVYCSVKEATTGDHVKPLKAFADDVNAGKMTKAEAVKAANAPENIAGACKSCNSSKGAREISDTPGPGKFVPPKPSGGS